MDELSPPPEGSSPPRRFGGLTPREAGLRGSAVAAARRQERAANGVQTITLRKAKVRALLDAMPDQDELAELCNGVVMELAMRVLEGDLRVNNAQHAAHLARVFHEIARSVSGVPGAVPVLTPDDRKAIVLELRNAARARKQA